MNLKENHYKIIDELDGAYPIVTREFPMLAERHATLTREVACKFARYAYLNGWGFVESKQVWLRNMDFTGLEEKTETELFSLAEAEGVFN